MRNDPQMMRIWPQTPEIRLAHPLLFAAASAKLSEASAMFLRTKKAGGHEYAQIVESRRVDGNPRQFILASLGRLPKNREQGLAMAEALIRFYTKDRPLAGLGETRDFLSVFVLRKFWERLGIDKALKKYAKDRRFDFSLEEAIFGMVCNRLLKPKSKLACADWLARDVYFPTDTPLDADHLYKAMTWLEEIQDDVEVDLFRRRQRGADDEPLVIFYDTTVTSFHGEGPEIANMTGRRGAPKGRNSILVGLVRTRDGWPLTHWIFPGSTNDSKTVGDVLFDLKDRFGIDRCVFVTDRGMISKDVLELLELMEFKYVIATKLRRNPEVRDEVLRRGGRYRKVTANLEVKGVQVEERRYVVCRNRHGMERDRKRREGILGNLRKALADGDRADTQAGRKILVKSGYKRLVDIVDGRIRISPNKVSADARFDGKWVLQTNIEAAEASELALLYKEEASIERDIRDVKSFYELSPFYHRTEPRVRAHVFICCVLAKFMERAIRGALHGSGFKGTSVDAVLEELGRVKMTRTKTPVQAVWARSPLKLTDRQERLLGYLNIPIRSIPVHLPDYDPGTPRKSRIDNGVPTADQTAPQM